MVDNEIFNRRNGRYSPQHRYARQSFARASPERVEEHNKFYLYTLYIGKKSLFTAKPERRMVSAAMPE
jgi:hypothetical protein